MKNTEYVSQITLAPKKWKIEGLRELKKLNDVTKMNQYAILFYDEVLEEVGGHELYYFPDMYSGYHQVRITPENQFKTTFTSP